VRDVRATSSGNVEGRSGSPPVLFIGGRKWKIEATQFVFSTRFAFFAKSKLETMKRLRNDDGVNRN
jgi:hypothetical protein